MFRQATILLIGALLLAACASEPPAPPAEPMADAPEPAVVTAEPQPDAPPPKPGQGNGRWRVAVASERTVEQTAPWIQRLEAQGYRAEAEAADVEGTTWQRVVLPGYTLDDAHAMIPILEQELSVQGVWIVPRVAAAEPASSEAPAEPTPAEPPAN